MNRFKLIHLFLLIFAFGCSSSSINKGDGISAAVESEFSWIENKDFIKRRQVLYISEEDKFEENLSEIDSLARESIDRLPRGEIGDVIDSTNVITKLSGLCHARKMNRAYKLIEKENRRFKKNPSFWNQVGTCHLLRGNFRAARLFYDTARDYKKNFAPAINNIGVIQHHRGNLKRAFSAYKKATNANRLSLTPSFNLAQLQLQGGQTEKALATFRALVRRNGRDKDALLGYANALLIKGDAVNAAKLFNRLPSSMQKIASVATNFSLALKISGKQSMARRILSRAREPSDERQMEYFNQVKDFIYKGEP